MAELRAPGEASGDDGALHGCVTCIFSRCTSELLCGGDSNSGPLFGVSTGNAMTLLEDEEKKTNVIVRN